MRCPYCGHTKNRVIDSRTSREGRAVRRRRQCQRCEERFTTYEVVEERPLSVKKRDGSVEPYDRTKLIRGIQLAGTKRPVTLKQIEEIVDGVEESLQRSESGEVESWQVGEQVMDALRDLDEVFGQDPFPYGIKANSKAFDMAQTFSVEQGLTEKKQPLDELFPLEIIYREERL